MENGINDFTFFLLSDTFPHNLFAPTFIFIAVLLLPLCLYMRAFSSALCVEGQLESVRNSPLTLSVPLSHRKMPSYFLSFSAGSQIYIIIVCIIICFLSIFYTFLFRGCIVRDKFSANLTAFRLRLSCTVASLFNGVAMFFLKNEKSFGA